MNPLLFLYFALGLVRDAMGAWYYLALSGRRGFTASFWAGTITLFDILVLATLLIQWKVGLAIAYSLGCAAGTFFVVRRKKNE